MPDDQPLNDVAAARQAFFDQYAQPQPQLPPEAFQPQVSQRQLIETWNKARNVEQAQKAVEAQMRMLGILRVKAAIEKGVDPAAATYSNLHLLAPAGSKQFAGDMRAVRPPPKPSMTNFALPGGGNIYGITQGGRTQIVPQSAMPKSTNAPTPFEFKTPEGKHLGWGIPGAGGGVHVLPEPATELKPGQQVTAITKALTEISGQLREAQTGSEEEGILKSQQQEYRKMLGDLVRGKKAAVPVGTVYKGHKFKGGDPSKKESWEKVE